MTNTYYDTYANSKGSHRNIILQPAEDMVSNFGGLRGCSDLQMFSKVKSDLTFEISNFDAVSMCIMPIRPTSMASEAITASKITSNLRIQLGVLDFTCSSISNHLVPQKMTVLRVIMIH